GQAVSGRTTIMAHSTNVYVGIGSDNWVINKGKPVTVNLITVTPDSQPKPGQIVNLTLARYHWTQQESGWNPVNMGPSKLTTGSDGKASYTLTLPDAGYYEITAQAKDEKGRESTSSFWVWVTEAGSNEW